MDSDPTIVPTAIPAIAPLLKPLEDEPDDVEPLPVEAAEVDVAVTVESKLAAVTLKQGTETSKSAASTKYCPNVSLMIKYQGEYYQTHNIGACVKRLVVAAILLLVIGPVFQLNGSVGAGSDRAGKGADLVALVARFDLRHVADDLLREVALLGGVWVLSVRSAPIIMVNHSLLSNEM